MTYVHNPEGKRGDRRNEKKLSSKEYYEQRKQWQDDTEDEVREVAPRWTTGTYTWNKKGARRPRVRVGTGFTPVLTDRQRTVLRHKVRLPRQWGRMKQIMKDTGMTMEEFVASLSPEELVRGQIKAADGTFRGAPPQWVPRTFHRACVHELMLRGKHLWQENYLKAIETMTKIAAGEGKIGMIATPGERIKAAQFVIERLEGKVPEVLKIQEEQPWEAVLDGIVADVSDEQIQRGMRALAGAQEALKTIEGEVEEVSDEPYEPEPTPDPARRAARRRAAVVRRGRR